MSDSLKITSSHQARVAIVYLRQSSAAQVENTRQTVLQRVKRSEIQAAHVTKGGKVGLRLKSVLQNYSSTKPAQLLTAP